MEIYKQEKLQYDGQQIKSIQASKKLGSDLIAVQSTSKGNILEEVYESENDITTFQWHPKLSDIAIGNSIGQIEIYNPLKKEVVQAESVHDSKIIFIDFSKQGDLMVTQDKHLKVIFWINLNPVKIDQKYATINKMIFVNYIFEDQDKPDNKIQLAFLGDKSGKIEYFEEKKLQLKELCQINGSIQEIFYLENLSTVIVLTTQGYLIQFRISTNEDINLEKKVKISTGSGSFKGLWIPNNSFVLNTGESSLKFWDIKNDINFSLNMFEYMSQSNQTQHLEIKDFAYNQNEKNLFVALSSGEIITFYNKNCQVICNKEEWLKVGAYKIDNFNIKFLILDKKGNLYVGGQQELVQFKRSQCKMQSNEQLRFFQKELDKLDIEEFDNDSYTYQTQQTIIDYIISNDRLIYLDDEMKIHKVHIQQLKQNKVFSNFDNHSIQVENHLKKIYLTNEVFVGIKDSKNIYFFNYQNELLLEFKNQSSSQHFIDIIVGQAKDCIAIIDNQYKMKILSTGQEIYIQHEYINLKEIVGKNEKVNQIAISKEARHLYLLISSKRLLIQDLYQNTKVQYEFKQNIKQMKLDVIDNRFVYASYVQEEQLLTDIYIYYENTIKFFKTIQTIKNYQLISGEFPSLYFVGYDCNNSIIYQKKKVQMFENLKENQKINQFARDFTINIMFENLKNALKNLKDIQTESKSNEFWNQLLNIALKNENRQIVEFCLQKNSDFLTQMIINQNQKNLSLGEIARDLGQLDFAKQQLEREKNYYQVCEILFIQENYRQLIEYIKQNKKCLLNFYYYKIAMKYYQIKNYNKFFDFWFKSGVSEQNLFDLFKKTDNLFVLEDNSQCQKNDALNKLIFKHYYDKGDLVKARKFIQINKENIELKGLFLLNINDDSYKMLMKQDQKILPIKIQEKNISEDSILTLIELYLKNEQFFKVVNTIKKNQQYFQKNEDIFDKIIDFLYNKAIKSKAPSVCAIAKYFEQCNFNEKAVQIYIQTKNYRRAYILAKKNNLNQALIEIKEKFEVQQQQPSKDQSNQFYQVIQNEQFDKATEILQNQPVFISQEQYQFVKNSNNDNKVNLQRQIAINWRQEGQYDNALRVFLDLRDNHEAAKTIMQKKDQNKLIQFTNFCRESKIYEMTANYLQNCNFTFNDNVYKAICTFYKKCKNYTQYEKFLKQYLIDQFNENLYDNCIKILQEIEKNRNFSIVQEQIDKELQMINIYKGLKEDQQENWKELLDLIQQDYQDCICYQYRQFLIFSLKMSIQNQDEENTNSVLDILNQKQIKYKNKLSVQQQQYLNQINPQQEIDEDDDIKEEFF